MTRQNSMLNPYFARRAWNRLRARRPMDRTHPSSHRRQEQIADGEALREELAEHFARSCRQSPPDTQPQKGLSAMIKLNCGVSRKVGEPNYGSRGASVNVELELESSAAQDADLLHDRIRRLFALAKASVDEELGLAAGSGTSPSPPASPVCNGQGTSPPAANGNGSRRATDGQLRAIWAISKSLGLDQDQEATSLFRRPVSELSLAEASRLIDHLKQMQGSEATP